MKKVEAGRYRHFKGKEYEVLFTARHSESEEVLVIYRALYEEGLIWARPLRMFSETVFHEGKEVPRFQKIN